MDVKKVLQDLMARSERTTFENEREVCLEKIKMLLAKHSITDINAFIRSEGTKECGEIPIEEIRNIFVAQFYPFFMDGTVIDEFDNVPVSFDKWTLEALKSRCDSNVVQFSKTVPNLAKVYGLFLSFVKGKLKELEIRKSILGFDADYMCNYIIVPREIAYWISDRIGEYFCSSEPGTIDEVSKDRIEKFLRDKKKFTIDLKLGYYDQTIKRVIDIKALPSSEKPVSYTEKETSTIMSHMQSTKTFRTGQSNKKSTKKKQESNWYVNLKNHSQF